MTTETKISKSKLKELKKDYIDKQISQITNHIFRDNMYTGTYEKEYRAKIKYNFHEKAPKEFFNDYKNIILNDMSNYNIEAIKHFILNFDTEYYYDLNGDEYDDYDKFETYLNNLSDTDIRALMNTQIDSTFDILDINTFENHLDDLGIYLTHEEVQ